MNPTAVLDRLIGVCIDSEKRYRHAAKDVSRADLESFFDRQAELSKRTADELQNQRKHLGVIKDESGTLAGVLDRAAMDLSVMMSKGDSGVVDWCRKDAEIVIWEYEKALAERLPSDLRPLLERQLREVRITLASLDQTLQAYGGPKS